MNKLTLLSAICLSGCAGANLSPDIHGPRIAYHQHLISPSFAPLVGHDPIDASALLGMMDEAGSERGVVLSMAYSFADERKQLKDPEALVRRENDWTATQVAVAPDRLRGVCSVNPLIPGALEEIERCNHLPGMAGLKLHFGNSGVSLRNAEHAGRMQQVFALANRLRIPIVVHLRSRSGTSYGAPEARLFLELLLPMVPDVPVQIAHLAGAGPGHSADADEALAVFVAAIAAGDKRVRRLVFDVTTVASADATLEEGALVAQRIRQIGVGRILFGSDMPIGANPALAPSWQLFVAKVPLTAPEFARIAANVGPY